MLRIGFLTVSTAFMLTGCLFANKCGLSPNYYDEKYSFYDSQGVYHEVCPSSNIINYKDIRPRYGAHNPYVYDDFLTPVPADSPRGIQAQQRELQEWERKQAELAADQQMTGGGMSAYSIRGYNPAALDEAMLGF